MNSLKNDQRIDQQTDRQQSLITLISLDDFDQRNDQQSDQRLTNDRPTMQETENEKEKRSKREKDKEKEINKTIKTDKNIHPPISPQGEKGDGIFLSSENSIFSFDKEVGCIPQTEEELNKWLEEDDGIDDWDKMQLYYKQLNSSQQSAASSQQDCYTENGETNSLDNTNPIQQKNKEIYIPQPQTPSPFAEGEHLPSGKHRSAGGTSLSQGEYITSQDTSLFGHAPVPRIFLPQGKHHSARGGTSLSQGEYITSQDTSLFAADENHSNTVSEANPYPLSPIPYSELFDEFWQAYPKKVGKGYAYDCFKKIKPSRKLLDTMLEAIAKQKKSDMWKRDKGQYIPNPSTWLNQKRWEDDLGGDTDDNPWSSFKLGIEL